MATSADMTRFRTQLAKRYGGRLTEKIIPYEIISTGSLTLDIAMRTGGWVRGRTHEIVGPYGSAKTTLGILGAIEHQRATKKAVGWIDMEQSFDWEWAKSLGLDTSGKMFTHIYPDNAEDVSDMLKVMSQSSLYSLIVIDSIGGMESQKAFDKDAGDVIMGKNAQIITRMVKLAAAEARKNEITVIYVNQLRANVSGMGVADIAAGPRALQYSTTFSIKMSKLSMAENILTVGTGKNIEEVGRRFKAIVQRSRVSPAGRIAEFMLKNQETKEFGPIGLDLADEAVSLGLRTGIIKQSGSKYTLPKGESFNSKALLTVGLRDNPNLVHDIRFAAISATAAEVTEETELVEEQTDD